ncbi:MAG: sulfotransferase family 2 domain-containing protein [Nanoarchaeota archaeon]
MYKDYDKIVFIHIPRTGGNTMKYTLRNSKYKDNFISSDHKPLSHYCKDKNKYFFFTIVRNPYKRIISWYNYHKHIIGREYRADFKSWVLDHDFKTHWPKKTMASRDPLSMWKFLCCEENDKIYENIFILKNENYENDYKNLLNFLGMDFVNLDIHSGNTRSLSNSYNKYKSKLSSDIKDYYDREMLDRVNERFKKDFELFNYERI